MQKLLVLPTEIGKWYKTAHKAGAATEALPREFGRETIIAEKITIENGPFSIEAKDFGWGKNLIIK